MNRLTFFFIASVFVFSSCKSDKPVDTPVKLQGEIFGTYYAVTYFCSQGNNYKEQIDSLLLVFNESLSYYETNSLISKINRNETDLMDEYFSAVLNRSLDIYDKTDGAFDATVAPLVNAWGFGFANKADMNQWKVDNIMQFVGSDMVSVEENRVIKQNPGIQFDFNAIAKGYASDLIANLLKSKGVNSYLVDIGGDLTTGDAKPDGSLWKIALERPAEKYDAPQQYDHIVEVKNRAIATSGSYRRYYEQNGERYSHTINPKTGYPVKNNLLSTTVYANDCMTADAYATAFMVMGLEKSREFVENRDDLDAFFIFSKNAEEFGVYATDRLDIIELEK